jgi:predicted nucleic acid-binding protein
MIVFDASTLILLAKVELMDLFLVRVGAQAVIPAEVERECCSQKKTLNGLMIQKALLESRIKVISVKNERIVARLRADFSLGRGEAEAVALSLKQNARLLGIDDKNGINACKVLGIPFTTAVGILVRSCENGLLDQSEALAKLEALRRYGRYKDSIIEDARLRLEARP